ncbi:unnamed protein product [Musa textilis]
MRYDYGPLSTPGYGPFSAYGPPGLMGGYGYGPDPTMDSYGYGYRGSPIPLPGPWSGEELPDNSTSRKRRGGPDGSFEGDWTCPKCGNINFAFRTTCNMKCGAPRPTLASNHIDKMCQRLQKEAGPAPNAATSTTPSVPSVTEKDVEVRNLL